MLFSHVPTDSHHHIAVAFGVVNDVQDLFLRSLVWQDQFEPLLAVNFLHMQRIEHKQRNGIGGDGFKKPGCDNP